MEKLNTITCPAYLIKTQRLTLRCWNPEDAALFKEAVDENIDHLSPWLSWAKLEPQSIESKIERMRFFRLQFDLQQDFTYGIFNPQENKVLGCCGLHTRAGKGAREIGYWIHKDFINKGLATETAAALTKVAFEIDKVDRVAIHCDIKNKASVAVPKKIGFTQKRTLRQQRLSADDKLRDLLIWELLASHYPSSLAFKAELEAYDVLGRRIG